MANDRIFLSNDTVLTSNQGDSAQGYESDNETFDFAVNETSVHGGANFSAGNQGFFIAPRAGRIVDVFIGVVQPALSASGFASGTVTGVVRINSVDVCSTDPSIAMAANSAQTIRTATNLSASTNISGVVNQASNTFAAGDQISYDYNTRSVGSAAAGAAGKGFFLAATCHYFAR